MQRRQGAKDPIEQRASSVLVWLPGSVCAFRASLDLTPHSGAGRLGTMGPRRLAPWALIFRPSGFGRAKVRVRSLTVAVQCRPF
jgi:hypothetical protein